MKDVCILVGQGCLKGKCTTGANNYTPCEDIVWEECPSYRKTWEPVSDHGMNERGRERLQYLDRLLVDLLNMTDTSSADELIAKLGLYVKSYRADEPRASLLHKLYRLVDPNEGKIPSACIELALEAVKRDYDTDCISVKKETYDRMSEMTQRFYEVVRNIDPGAHHGKTAREYDERMAKAVELITAGKESQRVDKVLVDAEKQLQLHETASKFLEVAEAACPGSDESMEVTQQKILELIELGKGLSGWRAQSKLMVKALGCTNVSEAMDKIVELKNMERNCISDVCISKQRLAGLEQAEQAMQHIRDELPSKCSEDKVLAEAVRLIQLGRKSKPGTTVKITKCLLDQYHDGESLLLEIMDRLDVSDKDQILAEITQAVTQAGCFTDIVKSIDISTSIWEVQKARAIALIDLAIAMRKVVKDR